jgi:ABC-2 type transport system permease protein
MTAGPVKVEPSAAPIGDDRGEPADAQYRATLADAVRSEWTKIRSLRFTPYALIGTPLIAAGYAALLAFLVVNGTNPVADADSGTFDPTDTSFSGLASAQQLLAALGVLVITFEYASGSIRSSLLAVPRRGRLLAAKIIVLTGVVLPLGQVTALVSFLVGQAVLASGDIQHADLGQPHVLRAAVGAGLYLTVVAVIGLAVGVIVRHTVGGLSILIVSTLVVPSLLGLLPGHTAHRIAAAWPFTAGRSIMIVDPGDGAFAPWPGFALLCGCALLLLALALLVFRSRDV